jgi:CRP/FNR family transcriptional activator FtrB
MHSIETMLQPVPGFAQLDRDSLSHVASTGRLVQAKAGQEFFREGMLPDWLYVLLDGRVSLTGTAHTSSAVVDIVGPASSFVLANVLAEEPYLMGACAVTPAQLVQIPAGPMRALVAARPAAATAMMRAMAAELGNLTRQVVDLKARVTTHRLGSYLLSLVNDPRAAIAEFRLPVPKGLLAPWLGCRAENLSRAFSTLRAHGVETHGSRVLLHDISRLKAYVGQVVDNRTNRAPEKIFGDAFALRRDPRQ